MTKDQFPTSPDQIDEFLEANAVFGKAFDAYVRSAVYLWQTQWAFSCATLDKLLETNENALMEHCKDCKNKGKCKGCPVDQYLDEVKNGRLKIKPDKTPKE